ncbi:MAG TPA: hypothetical protein VLG71_01835 [Candidatus Limnocylindria bacterium]|nr:hypothetical protein [Candidatus Limnocylindria bacterium]
MYKSKKRITLICVVFLVNCCSTVAGSSAIPTPSVSAVAATDAASQRVTTQNIFNACCLGCSGAIAALCTTTTPPSATTATVAAVVSQKRVLTKRTPRNFDFDVEKADKQGQEKKARAQKRHADLLSSASQQGIAFIE